MRTLTKTLLAGFFCLSVLADITEEDRKAGKVTIPASVIQNGDKMQVWLIGENRYGRLKIRRDIQVTD